MRSRRLDSVRGRAAKICCYKKRSPFGILFTLRTRIQILNIGGGAGLVETKSHSSIVFIKSTPTFNSCGGGRLACAPAHLVRRPLIGLHRCRQDDLETQASVTGSRQLVGLISSLPTLLANNIRTFLCSKLLSMKLRLHKVTSPQRTSQRLPAQKPLATRVLQ